MSVTFDRFFLMVLLAKPSAVELSTWVVLAGCGCPSMIIKVCIGTASWTLMSAAPISALAAKPITFDMIWEMEWMGLLRRRQVVGGFDMSGLLYPRK